MYNYTVNCGVMSITEMHIVFVCLRIGRLLMCMNWPSCLGGLSTSSDVGDASVHTGVTDARLCHTPCL